MIAFATLAASLVLLAPPSPDPVGTWPLRPVPEVVAYFDPPTSPYAAGHRGVDLLGTIGMVVRAALPGRVTFAGPLAGIGVVVIAHDTTRTTYQPVSAAVSVGDHVAAGDPIGSLVAAGTHCPPRACLHWGWLDGDTYLDPLRLVGTGPVRLLPLWRDTPLNATSDLPVEVSTGAPTADSAGPASRGTALPRPYASWRPVLQLLGLA